jgi:hypothetical protein
LTVSDRAGILPGSMHMPVFAGFTLAQPDGSNWMGAAAAWFLVVLPVCFAGLGLIAGRLPGMGPVRPELLPAFGVAAFVFAGGVLNLLHLVSPAAIWILLAAGFFASAVAAWRWARLPVVESAHGQPLHGDVGTWLLGATVIALMVVTLATQLAPDAYNWNDDLQSYFVHPVRMIETGTVFGSPLSSIGAVSLGGIAFVQDCVLLWLPIRAINGADAVLGLFLCLIPLVAFSSRERGLRSVALAAIAAIAIIDPFYVNVSALFLGSALIIAVILLSCESDTRDGSFTGGKPVAAGLIYAALIALKPTFLLFAGPHLIAVACASALAQGKPGAGLRWAAAAAASTVGFSAPWILVHLPHYLAPAASAVHAPATLAHQTLSLFGAEPLENGYTGLRAYTVLVASLAALAAASLADNSPAHRRSALNLGPAVAALVAVAAYPFMLFVFPRLCGYADADANAVRYFIPLAIGVFPIALCLTSRALMARAPAPARLGLCLSIGLLPLVFFSGPAALRYRVALSYHTLLPYPGAHLPTLAKAMDYALGGARQAQIRSLQERIPPGASLIAWIYTPYFLDFSRNTIFDAELAGISNRWGTPPAADYILWEYRGYADLEARVQRIEDMLPAMDGFRAAPLREFERKLLGQLKTGTVVFKDKEFVLLRTSHGGP